MRNCRRTCAPHCCQSCLNRKCPRSPRLRKNNFQNKYLERWHRSLDKVWMRRGQQVLMLMVHRLCYRSRWWNLKTTSSAIMLTSPCSAAKKRIIVSRVDSMLTLHLHKGSYITSEKWSFCLRVLEGILRSLHIIEPDSFPILLRAVGSWTSLLSGLLSDWLDNPYLHHTSFWKCLT